MTLGPDRPWAEASLPCFGPMAHRPQRARILEGRIRYEHPTQLLTYASAMNLEHWGLAVTRTHGLECFSCTLTAAGEAELTLLLEAGAERKPLGITRGGTLVYGTGGRR